jgi:hypothetical protein
VDDDAHDGGNLKAEFRKLRAVKNKKKGLWSNRTLELTGGVPDAGIEYIA